jgi:hypothetical protein
MNDVEFWWIYSPVKDKEWGGLRIAHFRKTTAGDDIVFITGEIDQRRVGARDWKYVQEVEGWYKVKQIPTPTPTEIDLAALNRLP